MFAKYSSNIYIYHGPLKPTFLEVFLVKNMVFRWPKPLFFMVLGAHGIQYGKVYTSFSYIFATGLESEEEIPNSIPM